MRVKSRTGIHTLIFIGLLPVLSISCEKDKVKDNNNPPESVTDIDGNIYNAVPIGTQVWMKENLKTTKFNDGTDITLVVENVTWAVITTPGYCWQNNDEASYKASLGALYNGYSVDPASNGGKNICPTGWHVPTDDDWTILTNYLGGEDVAGGKLKETGTTHWRSPNFAATNETGFTALAGGMRNYDGTYGNIGYLSIWWSSTMFSSNEVWDRYIYYEYAKLSRNNVHKLFGYSVRCLKDS